MSAGGGGSRPGGGRPPGGGHGREAGPAGGADGRGGLARRGPGNRGGRTPPPETAPAPPSVAPTPSRPPRPAPADARRVALEVLDRTLADEPRPFDEAFQGHPALGRLAVRDRAFARLLVTTVLRRLGQLDKAVLPFLRYRPKSPSVVNMLRLGAAQILFLSTPAHAAVGETVRLAQRGHAREVPLLNAVLRKVAAEGSGLLDEQDAGRLNTPRWLYESWAQAYGEETARGIALAHAGEAPLDLSVAREPERWAAELGAEILPNGTLRRRTGGLVEVLPGFEEGAWWVQDAAASLPARLLGDVRRLRVLDMCAAPGGKTAQLAAMGAAVTALERSPRRAEFLAGNLARLNLEAEIVVADANEWEAREPFDAVLLDAPCSATGTIRRHPDIPWVKAPADVTRLAEAQGRLLEAALRFAKPGAPVVYAVCSLQPEEGPERVAALLAARSADVERDPIRP
ncbi:MAG TPA: transcription antitermination factor NusB, partial [Geminicoccaceae bacterium]